jgi:hypothetical protein
MAIAARAVVARALAGAATVAAVAVGSRRAGLAARIGRALSPGAA